MQGSQAVIRALRHSGTPGAATADAAHRRLLTARSPTRASHCAQGAAPQLAAAPTAASEGFNVAVLGAAGGIGQPLSLLLKL